jgi:hypothetical protein
MYSYSLPIVGNKIYLFLMIKFYWDGGMGGVVFGIVQKDNKNNEFQLSENRTFCP